MKTVVELEREQNELKKRQSSYATLISRRADLQRTIEKLARPANFGPLEQILALCKDIDQNLTTRGFGETDENDNPVQQVVPAGFGVRALIELTAADGLKSAARRDEKRKEQLERAKADLEKIEKNLAPLVAEFVSA